MRKESDIRNLRDTLRVLIGKNTDVRTDRDLIFFAIGLEYALDIDSSECKNMHGLVEEITAIARKMKDRTDAQ